MYFKFRILLISFSSSRVKTTISLSLFKILGIDEYYIHPQKLYMPTSTEFMLILFIL